MRSLSEGLHERTKQKMEESKTMVELTCETCSRVKNEGDLHHKYEDVVVCDDCRKHTLHDIGRTG